MNQKYPSILDRVKSNTIDSIILIACMFLISDTLSGFSEIPDWVKMASLLSLLLYEPLCTTFGATLGHHKMDIRVRKNGDSTRRINFFQAVLRFFFKIFFGWLSFLAVFFNPKSRTIHDYLCGSVMIKIDD